MRIYQATETVAWYCPNCGRREAPQEVEFCNCGEKRIRASRSEWRLVDALTAVLQAYGCAFEIVEQYSVRDLRNFYWRFDFAVFITEPVRRQWLVEVQGPAHIGKARRDDDKADEAVRVGFEVLYMPWQACEVSVVAATAADLAETLIEWS